MEGKEVKAEGKEQKGTKFPTRKRGRNVGQEVIEDMNENKKAVLPSDGDGGSVEKGIA